MTIANRLNSKTPKFWKNVQRAAMIVGGIGATILLSPVALPIWVGIVATTAGTVATIAGQFAIEEDKEGTNE